MYPAVVNNQPDITATQNSSVTMTKLTVSYNHNQPITLRSYLTEITGATK